MMLSTQRSPVAFLVIGALSGCAAAQHTGELQRTNTSDQRQNSATAYVDSRPKIPGVTWGDPALDKAEARHIIEILWNGEKVRVVHGSGSVAYKSGTSDSEKNLFLLRHGLRLRARYVLDNGHEFDDVVFPENTPETQFESRLRELSRDPVVSTAEPNHVLSLHVYASPDDSEYRDGNQYSLSRIQVDRAWAEGLVGAKGEVSSGSPPLIAILDTGVDHYHEDLESRILRPGAPSSTVVGGYDFLSKDSDPMDTVGHGTAMAGLIGAATNNTRGIAGVTWQPKLLPVRIADENGVQNENILRDGLLYSSTAGARVVNMSFGGTRLDSDTLQTIDQLLRNGIIMVGGTGNTTIFCAGCNLSQNRAASYVNMPAAHPGVIAVGSVNESDYWSDEFSQYEVGKVTVVAPGEGIRSTYWVPEGNPESHKAYVPFGPRRNGTSHATAIVSGVAACVVSQNPDWAPETVMRRLTQTADKIRPLGYWVHGGPAISDSYDFNTGRHEAVGFGRVNAYLALGGIGTAVHLFAPGESYSATLFLRDSRTTLDNPEVVGHPVHGHVSKVNAGEKVHFSVWARSTTGAGIVSALVRVTCQAGPSTTEFVLSMSAASSATSGWTQWTRWNYEANALPQQMPQVFVPTAEFLSTNGVVTRIPLPAYTIQGGKIAANVPEIIGEGGELAGTPAVEDSEDHPYKYPKLPSFSGLRLFGYKPSSLVLPDDVLSLFNADVGFGALSLRGVKLNLCRYDSKLSPTVSEDSNVDGSMADAIDDASTDMSDDFYGAYTDLAAIKLFAPGEAAFTAAELMNPSSGRSILIPIRNKIAYSAFAAAPFNKPEGFELASLTYGTIDNNYGADLLLIGSGPLFDLLGVVASVQAVVNFVTNPSFSTYMATGSLGFFTESGLAALRCWAYSEIREQVTTMGFPGQAKYRGYFDAALKTPGKVCPPLSEPTSCNDRLSILKDGTFDSARKTLTEVAEGRLGSVSGVSLTFLAGDTKGYVTASKNGVVSQVAATFGASSGPPALQVVASIAPVAIAIAEHSRGDGLTTPEGQQAVGVGAVKSMVSYGTKVTNKIVQGIATGFQVVGAFLPLLEGANEAANSLAFRRNMAAALGDLLPELDPPAILTITSPVDQFVVGLTTDGATVRVEGHVSDYLPQLVRITVEIDGVEAGQTVLDLDSLTTDPGAKTGNAKFSLDVSLPHGGAHRLTVKAYNAGGHVTERLLTAYVDGTQFPREGSVALGLTSFRWRAKDGETSVAEGTGQLSFLSGEPGDTPRWQFTAANAKGLGLTAYYPDGTPNSDIVFVDPANDRIITSVPTATGTFDVRLKSFYEGKTFLGIVGNADSKGLSGGTIGSEWRQEFRGIAGMPMAGEFEDSGHLIISSGKSVPGTIYRLMHFWDIHGLRLTGAYSIRTRLTDSYLYSASGLVESSYTAGSFSDEDALKTALGGFGNLRVVDQANFTIGTPIVPGISVPTIVVDPYARVEVRFDAGALVHAQTIYGNVYPVRAPPTAPLQDPAAAPLGPKYEIVGAPITSSRYSFAPSDFNAAKEPRITVHYTRTELGRYGLSATSLFEPNLGLYREDPETGRRTLLQTNQPLGSFTVFTTTGYLGGSFMLLPANSAPRVKALAVSPLQFSPENQELDRPIAEVFMSVATPCSPTVFVTVEIKDAHGGVVRTLSADAPLRLTYVEDGEEAPAVVPEGADFRIALNAGNRFYHFVTTGAPRLAGWDGRDEDGALVAGGVYTVSIRVVDGIGNAATAVTSVVKDRLAPIISEIGGKPAASATLSAATDGTSVAIRGTAAGVLAYKGYRVAVRPSTVAASSTAWVGLAAADLPTFGWEYLRVPEVYYMGEDKDPFRSVIQINNGDLARWPIGAYSNTTYQAGLFIFGLANGTASTTTVVDATVVDDIRLVTPNGLRMLIATPNPFKSDTNLQVSMFGSATVVSFLVSDGANPGYSKTVTGIRSGITPVFTGAFSLTLSGAPRGIQLLAWDGGHTVSATGTALYIPDNSLLSASVFGSVDDSGMLTIFGAASATGIDVFDNWTIEIVPTGGTPLLLGRSMLPARGELLTTVDTLTLGGGGSATLIMTARDTIGNTRSATAVVPVPFKTALASTPVVLTPNGDGVGDSVLITTKMNRDASVASLVIARQSSGATVKTYTVPTSATLATFTWTGSGSKADDGTYIIRFTATPAGGGSAILRTATILHSASAWISSTLIAVSISTVPKAWFDLTVTGSGRYDVALEENVTLQQTGTEQWEDFPTRTATGQAHETYPDPDDELQSQCEEASSPVDVDFSQEVFVNSFFSETPDNEWCVSNHYWLVDGTVDSSGAVCVQTDGLWGQNAYYLSVPSELNYRIPSAAHHLYAKAELYCAPVNPFADLQVTARALYRSTQVGEMQYDSVVGSTSLGLVRVYDHRWLSRPFRIPIAPTHTSHFDSTGSHYTVPELGSETHSELAPAEGTVIGVNFNDSNHPPEALTGPSPAIQNDMEFTYSGLGQGILENGMTNLLVKRGYFGAPYVWGSLNRVLAGTVTAGPRWRDTYWTVTLTATDRFTMNNMGAAVLRFTAATGSRRIRPLQAVNVMPGDLVGSTPTGYFMRLQAVDSTIYAEYDMRTIAPADAPVRLEAGKEYIVSVNLPQATTTTLYVHMTDGRIPLGTITRSVGSNDTDGTINQFAQYLSWSTTLTSGGGMFGFAPDLYELSRTASGAISLSLGGMNAFSIYGFGAAHLKYTGSSATIISINTSGLSRVIVDDNLYTTGPVLSMTVTAGSAVAIVRGSHHPVLTRTHTSSGEVFFPYDAVQESNNIRLKMQGNGGGYYVKLATSATTSPWSASHIEMSAASGSPLTKTIDCSRTQEFSFDIQLNSCSGGGSQSSVYIDTQLPGGEYGAVFSWNSNCGGWQNKTVFLQSGHQYRITAYNSNFKGEVQYGIPVQFDELFTLTGSGHLVLPAGIRVGATEYSIPASTFHSETGGTIVGLDVVAGSLTNDNPNMTIEFSVTSTAGSPLAGNVKGTVRIPDAAWQVAGAKVRENVVRFEKGVPTKNNIFERLSQAGDTSATAIPHPDESPHTASWSVGTSPTYPDSSEADPDITVVTAVLSSTAMQAAGEPLIASDGFMLGETYSQMSADQVSAKLAPATVTPYRARTYLKIPGNTMSSSRYIVEVQAPDGSSRVVKDSTIPPTPKVLAYAEVTGQVGEHIVTVTEDGPSGVRQQRMVVDVGHAVGSTVTTEANPGGVAFDAYEAASLLVPAGGFVPGVRKSMFLRQISPSEVPLLSNSGLVAGLVYDLLVSPTRLNPDNFVQNDGGSVKKPAILTIHYDEAQLPPEIPESNMNLYRISTEGDKLEVQGGLVDTVANVIVTEVIRSSVFQVVADISKPAFKVTVAPNPSSTGPVSIVVTASKTLPQPPQVFVSTPGNTDRREVTGLKVEERPVAEGLVKGLVAGFTLTVAGTQEVRRDYAIIKSFSSTWYTAEYEPQTSVGATVYTWTGSTIYFDGVPFTISGYELFPKPNGLEIGVRISPVGQLGADIEDVAPYVQPGSPWTAALDSGLPGIPSWTRSGTVQRIGGQDIPQEVVVLKQFEPGEPFILLPGSFWAGKHLEIGGTPFTVSSLIVEGTPAAGGRAMVRLTGITDAAAAGVAVGVPWTLRSPVPRWSATFTVTGQDGSGTATVYVSGTDAGNRSGQGRAEFRIIQGMAPLAVTATPRVSRAGSEMVVRVAAGRQLSSLVLTATFADPAHTEIIMSPESDTVEGTEVPIGTWVARRTVLANDVNGPVIIRATGGTESGLISVTTSCFIDTVAPSVTVWVSPSPARAGGVFISALISEPVVAAATVFDSAMHAAEIPMLPTNGTSATSFSGVYFVSPGATAEGVAQAVVVGIDEAGNAGLRTGTFTIDMTPPAAPVCLSGFPGAGRTTLVWLDNVESDLAGYVVKRDGTSLTGSLLPSPSGPCATYLDDSVQAGTSRTTYQVVAVDTAGNESAPAAIDVVFDVSPPSATLFAGPLHYGDSPAVSATWYEAYGGNLPLFLGPTTPLAFSTTDAGLGVLSTEVWVLPSGKPITVESTLSSSVLDVSNTLFLVAYRSTDVGGTASPLRTATLYVDTVAPSTALTISGPYLSGTTFSISLGITVPSATLSQAEVTAMLESVGISLPEGTTLIFGSELQDLMETAASTTTFGGVFIGSLTQISLSATDAGSGVPLSSIMYRCVSGTVAESSTAYYAPFTLGNRPDGFWRIEHTATDRVGNTRPLQLSGGFASFLMYDGTPPTTTCAVMPAALSGGGGTLFVMDSASFWFGSADGGPIPTGLDRIEWWLDNDSPAVTQPGVVFRFARVAYGPHTIHFRGVDRVGNVETTRTFGPFILTTRDWPRHLFSNDRGGAPDFGWIPPPYAIDWYRGLPPVGDGGMLVVGDRVLAFSHTRTAGGCSVGRLDALDFANGSPVWSVTATTGNDLASVVRGITYEDGRLVATVGAPQDCGATTFADLLRAFSSTTGSVAWTLTNLGGLVQVGPPMAAGGIVYVVGVTATGTGGAVAVSIADGTVAWSRTLPLPSAVHLAAGGAPAVRDGLVVVATTDGVVALDAVTGWERWRRATYPPTCPPAIGADFVAVPATNSGAPGVAALDLDDGGVRWFHATSGTAFSGVAVDPNGQVAVTLTPSGVEVLDRTTGNLLWRSPDRPMGEPVLLGGLVYVAARPEGGGASRAVALRRATSSSTAGVEAWAGPHEDVAGSPVIARGRVLFQRTVADLRETLAYVSSSPFTFRIDAPSPLIAGVGFTVTVTATDSQGATMTNYAGTVRMTSTDPLGRVPGDALFTAQDAGVRRLTVTLFTEGSQIVSARDVTVTFTPTGSATVYINTGHDFVLFPGVLLHDFDMAGGNVGWAVGRGNGGTGPYVLKFDGTTWTKTGVTVPAPSGTVHDAVAISLTNSYTGWFADQVDAYPDISLLMYPLSGTMWLTPQIRLTDYILYPLPRSMDLPLGDHGYLGALGTGQQEWIAHLTGFWPNALWEFSGIDPIIVKNRGPRGFVTGNQEAWGIDKYQDLRYHVPFVGWNLEQQSTMLGLALTGSITGWAAGLGGEILQLSGSIWTAAVSPGDVTAGDLYGVAFYDSDYGVAVGGYDPFGSGPHGPVVARFASGDWYEVPITAPEGLDDFVLLEVRMTGENEAWALAQATQAGSTTIVSALVRLHLPEMAGGMYGFSLMQQTGTTKSRPEPLRSSRKPTVPLRLTSTRTGDDSVEFAVRVTGNPEVVLSIYTPGHRPVRQLCMARRNGVRRLGDWDGRDSSGREVEPGWYFAQVRAGDRVGGLWFLWAEDRLPTTIVKMAWFKPGH